MIKKIFLFALLLAPSLSFALSKAQMYDLYQNKEYESACVKGISSFARYRTDEEYVSMYAFSCLYSDYIDRLAVPISVLKRTKESRSNASYLSVIIMQKKLLYHSLIDSYELKSFKLPTTDYILSKVFDLYTKRDTTQKQDRYKFIDQENPRVSYVLYLQKDEKIQKMVIEHYFDEKLLKTHTYW